MLMLTLARKDFGNFLVLDGGLDFAPPGDIGQAIPIYQLLDPEPPLEAGVDMRDAVVSIIRGQEVLLHGLLQAKVVGTAEFASPIQHHVGLRANSLKPTLLRAPYRPTDTITSANGTRYRTYHIGGINIVIWVGQHPVVRRHSSRRTVTALIPGASEL